MRLDFRTRKLRKCYEKEADRTREWGQQIARHYLKAVMLLEAAPTPSELAGSRKYRPHPLTGNRKGEWAMVLTDRARLIFTHHQDGGITIARIEEVNVKHYG